MWPIGAIVGEIGGTPKESQGYMGPYGPSAGEIVDGVPLRLLARVRVPLQHLGRHPASDGLHGRLRHSHLAQSRDERVTKIVSPAPNARSLAAGRPGGFQIMSSTGDNSNARNLVSARQRNKKQFPSVSVCLWQVAIQPAHRRFVCLTSVRWPLIKFKLTTGDYTATWKVDVSLKGFPSE
jgi:hypothetical protein